MQPEKIKIKNARKKTDKEWDTDNASNNGVQ
jgi:hypothetical protein